tara:strand:+ start:2123 stop:4603 length:2481 start_codon:yes stop_codon:yes gene_type:complete
MGITRINQTAFHSGELDPILKSRNDLSAYGKGLQKARNVMLRNQGAIERRPGSFFRADLGGQSRLESFIFSSSQEYIFAFQNTVLKIYSTAGALLQTISSCPWDTASLFELSVTQQGDTMIVVHKDFMPRIITRTGATTFTLTTFAFDSSINGEKVYQPYFKFADDTITLDIDSVTKDATGVTCTTSSAYFTSDYVGTRIRYMGAELLITGYTSSTVVTATLKSVPEMILDEDPFAVTQGSGVVTVTHVAHGFSTGASLTISGSDNIFDTDGNGLSSGNLNGARTITVIDDNHYQFTAGSGDTATESVDAGGVRVSIVGHPPTRNWDEQVFSDINGYPKAVAFHQQRLFFGGVENLPDGIQSSKVASFFNFDVGDAEDNESIQIQIASDEINEIRHLISGKVLEVLTNTSEFYLKASIGKPLTPADIEMVRQSTFGSQQKAMPRQYDGGTIYVQNNGKTVREYVYNSSTEEFASAPVSMLSSHLVTGATDTASIDSLSDRDEQLYMIVNSDGTIAVYSAQRLQEVAGWMQWNTTGTFESVTTTTDFIYVAVKRTINSATVYYLEQIASTSFDIPTDMTVTKTLSASYQPHGSPLTNGTTSSSTGFIADGFTNAPQVGEKFKFAGTGTEYTINAATATSNSGEYNITINAAVSTTNNVELRFTYSKTWSGLNSAPDMRGLVVHGTSGSTEGGNINYYGDGTVTSGGVVVLDSVAAAIDIGIDYTFEIDTMPADGPIGASSKASPLTFYPRKIAKAVLALSNTYNVKVNTMDIVVNDVSNLSNADTLTAFTGSKTVHFLGYNLEPNLSITQSAPLPVRILTITTEIYY